jgi:hypothetical protein
VTGKEIAGYLVHASRDGSMEFRIADAVVRTINAEVMRGFGVTRRRGTEVGGLLLGSLRKRSVSVDDCEIVPCEYAYGPSYLLSENDAPRFADAVARWRPAAGVDKYVVGFFRSHTRDGLQPDAADMDLFATHFSGAAAIALLIKPYASRSSDAAVFVPEDGRLSATPAFEFPFAPAVPPEEPARGARRHSEPAPAPAPPPRPQAQTVRPDPPPEPAPAAKPEPVRLNEPVVLPRMPTERERLLQNVLGPIEKPVEERPRRHAPEREMFGDYTRQAQRAWWSFLPWTLFIASALFFGYALGHRQAGGDPASLLPWMPKRQVQDVYALGLNARSRGDSILISWDRDAAPLKNAGAGTMVISTGDRREEIALAAEELRTGLLLYKSDASEAGIRLEVPLGSKRLLAEQTTWRRSVPVQ